MFSFLSLLEYLLVFGAPLVWAEYTIDDTNTTIQYIPNGIGVGVQWHTAMAPEVNITASFNQTTTVGECNSSQNCHLKIPFIGSGITIYVVQVNFAAINVSVTVDSLQPTIRTFPEPQWYLHNFSLFDIQELPSGNHTIDMALLDTQYNTGDKYAYTNGTSALAFDYAIVNDQLISPSSTPVTSPAQSSSASSTGTKSSVPIGAIAGGAAGGLAVIVAFVICLVLLCRRSGRQDLLRRKSEIDPEPKVRPVAPFARSTVYTPVHSPSRTTPSSAPPSASSTQNLYASPSPPPSDRYAYTALAPTTHNVPAAVPSMVIQNPSDRRPDVASTAAADSSTSSSSSRPLSKKAQVVPSLPPSATKQLTPEQLDFVHNLYSLNVPAAEIAGVMERMRVEREAATAGTTIDAGVVGSPLSDSKMSEAPPRYEPR